jgi:hypothetical protein
LFSLLLTNIRLNPLLLHLLSCNIGGWVVILIATNTVFSMTNLISETIISCWLSKISICWQSSLLSSQVRRLVITTDCDVWLFKEFYALWGQRRFLRWIILCSVLFMGFRRSSWATRTDVKMRRAYIISDKRGKLGVLSRPSFMFELLGVCVLRVKFCACRPNLNSICFNFNFVCNHFTWDSPIQIRFWSLISHSIVRSLVLLIYS